MILADTSVWIDHIRSSDAKLVERLENGAIVMHPFILGEIAVGSLRDRTVLLSRLGRLPFALSAQPCLVLQLIEAHQLYSRGLSYFDISLLASARLTPETALWTRDRRLAAAADELGVGIADD